jgi:peptidoglycan/xylan/chitin deacetylase (PgdA/CDA1 family)
MTHPALPNLPGEAQQAELLSSKRRLEDILGSLMTSFSHPYGTQSDYTTDTMTLVREAGLDCACSNFLGPVTFACDASQFPRFLVSDRDREEFARRLEGWFCA